MAAKGTVQKKGKRKKRRSPAAGICLLVAAVLALVFYFSGGVRVHTSRADAQAEIRDNVERLFVMARQTPVDLNEEARQRYQQMLRDKKGILVDDLAAEQAKILSLTGHDKAAIQRWFARAAIVGDSIAMEVKEYKWAGTPPIYAKIGVRALADLDLFDDVEAAQPEVVFLTFGMNDLEVYKDQVNVFISRYSACVERLQKSLPDALIYVSAVFPASAETQAKKPQFKYVDLYNEELQKMCDQLGVFFVDSSFILRAEPSWYAPDGIHMRGNFYPLWLTYLADVSGLSNDDEE